MIGLVLGVFFGFAAALIPFVADVLEPVMMLLNAIPRVILAPLFVIWLGIELPSKIALAVVLVAVLMFFAVYSGIKDVNQLFVDRVRTLGGGRMILLREVYIPSVTAWVLGSLKVAVGFAFTGAVVGEFVAATRGLGYLLQFAQSTYNAALTMGLIFLIMVLRSDSFRGGRSHRALASTMASSGCPREVRLNLSVVCPRRKQLPSENWRDVHLRHKTGSLVESKAQLSNPKLNPSACSGRTMQTRP